MSTSNTTGAGGANCRDTPSPATGALEFNPENYRGELNEFDMDDAQKNELLRVLFEIMRSFVEMGLDVDNISPLLQGRDGESVQE